MADEPSRDPWHSAGILEVYRLLDSGSRGLTSREATARLRKYGPNRLARGKKLSAVYIFLHQFKSSLIYILILAMAIALIMGDLLDASIIGAAIALNAFLGFVQEYKAEKSLESIKKMIVRKATVVRDGKEKEMATTRIVPGDVIEVDAGDSVPADARIVEARDVKVDESALTGEAEPASKMPGTVPPDTVTADMHNMLFMGTTVVSGHASAIVVSTGMATKVGNIASLVETEQTEEIPLKKKLNRLGKAFGLFSIAFSLIIFVAGFLQGIGLYQIFMVALSLVVAAIPEGLPAIVTITLALGVQRMARKKAIVRKLHAVETLGSTDLICSDKTGTLTQNVITVQDILIPGQHVKVTGFGYSREGELQADGRKVDIEQLPGLGKLLTAAALCNNAIYDPADKKYGGSGDSTEIALLVAASKAGLEKEPLESRYPRLYELPFSSESKHMITVHKADDSLVAYVKGSPELILSKCTGILKSGRVAGLSDEDLKDARERNTRLAYEGKRMLAFACKEVKCEGEDDCLNSAEEGLVYLGITAMIDPPRPEAKRSVKICEDAGIKVVMVTGDQKPTAVAIARDMGIFKEGDIAITGPELNRIDDDRLAGMVDKIDVYARITPEQKLRIVEAAQKKGLVVAMTGDGVNDAPALKRADIGVAMGITGTDVARQASDMILGDDNFATIQAAIDEGRGILENVKKFIKYTFSGNLGQVTAIFAGIMLGLPLPVFAIQVLWINLITDTFPALALSFDPYEKDLMKPSYKQVSRRLITRTALVDMAIVGAVMIAGILGLYYAYLPRGLDYARSIAFTSIVMFKLWNSLNCRSETKSTFSAGILDNKYLVLAIVASFLLQMAAIYLPFLEGVFVTMPTDVTDLAIIVAVTFSVVVAIEIRKLVTRQAS